jgi:bacterioferritin
MLETLQRAVDVELTISQHYWSRSVFWVNVPRLAEMYQKEAEEERGHAKLMADRSVVLGRQPSMAPQAEMPTSGTIREQFTEDLKGEVAVAEQYRGWVQRAMDSQDFATEDVLRKILKETEDHAEWVARQLDSMDQLGDENYQQTWH